MIFLDFDGTVADIWMRYYKVFSAFCDNQSITFDKYKKYKQTYRLDSSVAEKLGLKLSENYFEIKKLLLEDLDFLKYDTLFIPLQLLNTFLARPDVMLLVKRRSEQNFLKELEDFGIKVSKHIVIKDGSKKDYVMKNYPNEKSVVIGDSAFDLEVAELPYVTAYMVGYGLQSREYFDSKKISYNYISSPDKLCDLIETL